MWSGWGIRTLSSDHPSFNPYNYQTGAVWPHDNSLIALGMRRYGFAKEAAAVALAIISAANHFLLNRLPELYAGLQREPRGFPVQYLGANVPQAWAAGATFMVLKRCWDYSSGLQVESSIWILRCLTGYRILH